MTMSGSVPTWLREICDCDKKNERFAAAPAFSFVETPQGTFEREANANNNGLDMSTEDILKVLRESAAERKARDIHELDMDKVNRPDAQDMTSSETAQTKKKRYISFSSDEDEFDAITEANKKGKGNATQDKDSSARKKKSVFEYKSDDSEDADFRPIGQKTYANKRRALNFGNDGEKKSPDGEAKRAQVADPDKLFECPMCRLKFKENEINEHAAYKCNLRDN